MRRHPTPTRGAVPSWAMARLSMVVSTSVRVQSGATTYLDNTLADKLEGAPLFGHASRQVIGGR